MTRRRATFVLLVSGVLLAGCSLSDGSPAGTVGTSTSGSADASVAAESRVSSTDEALDSSAMSAFASRSADPVPSTAAAPSTPPTPTVDVLPGMPPVVDPHNIYSEAGTNMLGAVAQQSKAYAYVPDNK